MVDNNLIEFALRPLIRGTADHYWPVLGATAIYLIFAVTSFRIKEPSVTRRAFLACGVACIVHAWAFLTIWAIAATASGWHGQLAHPHRVIRIGLESSVCLIAVLLPLTVRNLISRRIQMPTAFTLGIGASIAAVYGDLMLVLWAATPLK